MFTVDVVSVCMLFQNSICSASLCHLFFSVSLASEQSLDFHKFNFLFMWRFSSSKWNYSFEFMQVGETCFFISTIWRKYYYSRGMWKHACKLKCSNSGKKEGFFFENHSIARNRTKPSKPEIEPASRGRRKKTISANGLFLLNGPSAGKRFVRASRMLRLVMSEV